MATPHGGVGHIASDWANADSRGEARCRAMEVADGIGWSYAGEERSKQDLRGGVGGQIGIGV